MKKLSLLLLLLVLGCSNQETLRTVEIGRSEYVIIKISGTGGALGDEEYSLTYRNGNKERTFFEGVNPRQFAINTRKRDVIKVRFCDGSIRKAEPVFVERHEKKLLHVDIELYCEA